jgi:hypothetical protein
MSMIASGQEREAAERNAELGGVSPAHPSPQESLQHAGAVAHSWLLAVFLILYALFNLADLASTYIGLQHGMHEGNPLMSQLLAAYGFGALIGYKLMVVGVVSVGVIALRQTYPRVAGVTVVVCNVLVAGAVLLNVLQFTLL